jgi:hypothetical protein
MAWRISEALRLTNNAWCFVSPEMRSLFDLWLKAPPYTVITLCQERRVVCSTIWFVVSKIGI